MLVTFGTCWPYSLSDSPNGRYAVTLVSGEQIHVLTQAEKRWFDKSRDSYLAQTKFSDNTDLVDLDRLLGMELQVFRLTNFLAQGEDYEGFEIDDTLLRRNVREYSEQINRTKDSMGLTKKARDEAASEGDFSTWLSNLKTRAKIFGIHREKQLTRSLVLMNELSAIVGSYDRSDEEERQKLGFIKDNDILDWIRNIMLPEFRELDEHFRKNEQRYWIREQ